MEYPSLWLVWVSISRTALPDPYGQIASIVQTRGLAVCGIQRAAADLLRIFSQASMLGTPAFKVSIWCLKSLSSCSSSPQQPGELMQFFERHFYAPEHQFWAVCGCKACNSAQHASEMAGDSLGVQSSCSPAVQHPACQCSTGLPPGRQHSRSS